MIRTRVTIVVAIAICGCASIPDRDATEQELFKLALHEATELAGALPLRVDPRPVDPAPNNSQRHVFAEDADAERSRRAAVLAARGIDPIDMLGPDCRGDGGTPPPPPPPGRDPRPPYTPPTPQRHVCAIFSLIRPGGAHYPHGGVDIDSANRRLRTLRVWMTGPGRWRMLDLVFEQGAGGEWRAVRQELLQHVVSD